MALHLTLALVLPEPLLWATRFSADTCHRGCVLASLVRPLKESFPWNTKYMILRLTEVYLLISVTPLLHWQFMISQFLLQPSLLFLSYPAYFSPQDPSFPEGLQIPSASLFFSSHLNSKQTQWSAFLAPAHESHRLGQISGIRASTAQPQWAQHCPPSSWTIYFGTILPLTMTISNFLLFPNLQPAPPSPLSLSTDRQSSSFSERRQSDGNNFYFYSFPPNLCISITIFFTSVFFPRQSLYSALGLISPYLQLVRKLSTHLPFSLWDSQQCPENSILSFNLVQPLSCATKNMFTLQPPHIFSPWQYLWKVLFIPCVAVFPFYLILKPFQSKFNHHHYTDIEPASVTTYSHEVASNEH